MLNLEADKLNLIWDKDDDGLLRFSFNDKITLLTLHFRASEKHFIQKVLQTLH